MRTLKLVTTTTLFLLLLAMVSCKESTKNAELEDTKPEVLEEVTEPSQKVNTSNYLCKVNGKDWEYTKATGIISMEKKTNKLTAIITFKKKLEKGSESIQLYYDANTNELIEAALQLKFPKKDGSLFTAFYQLKPELRAMFPDSEMSGTIDLSNPETASGNAELKDFVIRHEKNQLKNPEDANVNVTGLKFSGIPYSDLEKLFK